MFKNDRNLYDLDFVNGDLKLTASLRNSVLLSLGIRLRDTSDGKAIVDPVNGGWFGHALEDKPIGSFIWKDVCGKLDQSVLDDLISKAKESLKWMIDDGVAASVEVAAKISSTLNNVVDFVISVVKPDSTNETFEFQANWEATV